MASSRSASVYADFLLPHLADGLRVLDVGCGPGSITLGLAAEFPGARFVGVDPEDEFEPARHHAADVEHAEPVGEMRKQEVRVHRGAPGLDELLKRAAHALQHSVAGF